MASYSTVLKSWGASGAEYPDGYSYAEGEQPVDDWDNFLTNNVIADIQHLVSLTNDRVESDSGASGNEPTSPETAHLYVDTDAADLEIWDANASAWDSFIRAGGDTFEGDMDAAGFSIDNIASLTSNSGPLSIDSAARVAGGKLTLSDFADLEPISEPAAPAGSDVRLFVDSADNNLKAKEPSGDVITVMST